jgi:tetratricopeptide (TPR) repeat protein
MMTNSDSIRLLHHWLDQGRVCQAQSRLSQLVPDADPCDPEIAYLAVWCATSLRDFDEVVRRVCEPPFVEEGATLEDWLTSGTVRRRCPGALLYLGRMAESLGYPKEAQAHYQHCLRRLSERRMDVPAVRHLAHAALGALALAEGRGQDAAVHYQNALSPLEEADPTSPLQGFLCAGLCRAYAQQQMWTDALTEGLRGLPWLREQEQEALLLLLCQIATALRDFAAAHGYAEQAWELAFVAHDPTRMAAAWGSQANIFFAEGQLLSAMSTGEQAWGMAEPNANRRLQSQIALCCAKTAAALFVQESNPLWAKQALSWYAQARASTAEEEQTQHSAIAVGMAQIHEARGDYAQALASWKQAYELLSGRPIAVGTGGPR